MCCIQPLNESSEVMTLDVEYQPISAGTLRLWVTMMESFRNLRGLGDCYTCAGEWNTVGVTNPRALLVGDQSVSVRFVRHVQGPSLQDILRFIARLS